MGKRTMAQVRPVPASTRLPNGKPTNAGRRASRTIEYATKLWKITPDRADVRRAEVSQAAYRARHSHSGKNAGWRSGRRCYRILRPLLHPPDPRGTAEPVHL